MCAALMRLACDALQMHQDCAEEEEEVEGRRRKTNVIMRSRQEARRDYCGPSGSVSEKQSNETGGADYELTHRKSQQVLF